MKVAVVIADLACDLTTALSRSPNKNKIGEIQASEFVSGDRHDSTPFELGVTRFQRLLRGSALFLVAHGSQGIHACTLVFFANPERLEVVPIYVSIFV